ncbi:TetR family transcriptional regulator [Streptomyces sp. NPDC059783]|uniref:TetR family transcriptional regulator n=1 Tax=Streptomyces sp. NPDC059783 TaxID=3346944 RepID=UPI00364E216F
MNNAAVAAAPARPRGRPPGRPPTRAAIVSAARALFLERGYRATTVRAVAGAAGVDAALISYHFGSKKGLFAEVMQVRCADVLGVEEVLGGDPAGLPGRLVDAVTGLWEDPDFRRLSGLGGEGAEAVREYLETELLARLVEFLGGRDVTARATAVVTVLGGLIYTRYVNPLPTPAALTRDQTRAVLAPVLRAALGTRPARPASAPAGRRRGDRPPPR